MASPIAFLAGVWRGSGRGTFPTMEPFEYEEEVRFTDLGVPAMVYAQRAWSPADGELLHLETGLWRCTPDGALAVSVALPRVTEISEGAIADNGVITLAATSVRRAQSGGAALVAVRREYRCRKNRIDYRVAMATERVAEVSHHLAGSLRRVSPG